MEDPAESYQLERRRTEIRYPPMERRRKFDGERHFDVERRTSRIEENPRFG